MFEEIWEVMSVRLDDAGCCLVGLTENGFLHHIFQVKLHMMLQKMKDPRLGFH